MGDSGNRIDSMEDLDQVSEESFMDYVCVYERIIQLVFLVSAFFTLVSLAGVVFLEWGSPSHVIATWNLVTLTAFGVVSGAALYACNNRA